MLSPSFRKGIDTNSDHLLALRGALHETNECLLGVLLTLTREKAITNNRVADLLNILLRLELHDPHALQMLKREAALREVLRRLIEAVLPPGTLPGDAQPLMDQRIAIVNSQNYLRKTQP